MLIGHLEHGFDFAVMLWASWTLLRQLYLLRPFCLGLPGMTQNEEDKQQCAECLPLNWEHHVTASHTMQATLLHLNEFLENCSGTSRSQRF